MRDIPIVVCLVGSTRFRKEYAKAFYQEEHDGRICLTVPCYKDDACCKAPEDHARLDEMHLAKIDMADCILVVSDEAGYIGESTGKEIAYAIKAGKVVRWLHPAAKAIYFGVDAPSKPETPAAMDAPSKADERTWWEFASDGCAHLNDQWFGFLGNPHAEVLTDAMTATHRLHFLAWDGGKTTIEPNQALSKKDAIHAMEEVYGNHRGWARAGLKTYLGDTLAEAKAKHDRKAQQGAEVAA